MKMKTLLSIKERVNKGVAFIYSIPVRMRFAVLMLMTGLMTEIVPVFAAENDYDFLKKGGDMFSGFNTAVTKTTASGMKFLKVLGYILLFCLIVTIGIARMQIKNPQQSSENKKKALVGVAAAVLIFGGGSIAIWIATAGDAL